MAFNTTISDADIKAIEAELSPEAITALSYGEQVAETAIVAEPQTAVSDPEETMGDDENSDQSHDDIDAILSEERKKIEKELRKKYLSQVSKKEKERQEALSRLEEIRNNYEPDQLNDIEALVEYKLEQKEKSALAIKEEQSFFRKYPEMKSAKDDIQDILSDFPNMSWETARTIYLSNTNPEALISKKPQSMSMQGNLPQSVSNTNLNDAQQLEMEARKELEAMMRM